MDVYYKPDSNNRFSSVYLVMDYMSMNLGQLIRSQKIEPKQLKFFAYQIFRGLKYLHSADIIHRVRASRLLVRFGLQLESFLFSQDLKPANLVINEECELKVRKVKVAVWQKAGS